METNGIYKTDTRIGEIEGVSIQKANNNWITLDNITAYEHVDGIILQLKLVNNTSNIGYPNDMFLGYEGNPVVLRLLTDEGVFEREFPQTVVLPVDEYIELEVGFQAKGQPLALSLANVYDASDITENGTPENPDWMNRVSFHLEPITSERAEEIGEELTTKLLEVDLAKTEEEAKEVLIDTLGGIEGELPKNILAAMEYGKYKSVEPKFMSTNAYFDTTYGLINYFTNMKVTYTLQDGSTETVRLDLVTSIKPNVRTGNYSFFSFQAK